MPRIGAGADKKRISSTILSRRQIYKVNGIFWLVIHANLPRPSSISARLSSLSESTKNKFYKHVGIVRLFFFFKGTNFFFGGGGHNSYMMTEKIIQPLRSKKHKDDFNMGDNKIINWHAKCYRSLNFVCVFVYFFFSYDDQSWALATMWLRWRQCFFACCCHVAIYIVATLVPTPMALKFCALS